MELCFLKKCKSLLNTLHLRHVLPDIAIITASLYISLHLRVGNTPTGYHIQQFYYFLPSLLLTRIFILTITGSYTILWRYISARDSMKLARSVFLSSVIVLSLSFFLVDEVGRLPRSVYLIEFLLTLLGMMAIRLQRRLHWERKDSRQIKEGQRTLIYGAGYNGRTLANRYNSDVGQETNIIGFIDDDPKKQDLSIVDVRVLGSRKDLPLLIEKLKISQIIIAATQVDGEFIRDIVQITRPFNIKPRIITRDRADSNETQNAIDRNINLADLLNRQPKQMDQKEIKQLVSRKRVLITGAGGSIGSEIARQIIALDPSRLILLDHSEYNLYEIDRELRLSTDNTEKVVPLLIDIKDRIALLSKIKEYNPEIIFHAAAYKHVHLVEANPHSAILNNIAGTKNLLDAAETVNVKAFVLISSDKAVNPAGVMGATKRVCELMTTAMGEKTRQQYCSVRFGNVLGSSGSLIPLLKKQLNEGGPLTITHKDMTRYFMTIPEAVSLVLKAYSISRPGDINVLKMGKPVKIMDIASSLIALMGKNQEETSIIYTGLRPGEKMYEELYITGKELKTAHPDILTLPDGDNEISFLDSPDDLLLQIEKMINYSQEGVIDAIYILNQLVKSTYVPPGEVLKESQQVSNLITPKKYLDN